MSGKASKQIGFYNIDGLFRTAYLRAAMMGKGIKCFDAGGIYPLNPEKL